MARWKISNSFIEEVAIKMLSTATYIQNKNNPAYTALHVVMGVFFLRKQEKKKDKYLCNHFISKKFCFWKKMNTDLLANFKCHEPWTSLTLFKSTSWNY